MAVTVQEHFQLPCPSDSPHVATSREFICGIEYEIESLRRWPDSAELMVENDASLRNNGKEFKTFPNPLEKQLELFKYLHKEIKTGKDPFSYRTSIHVHVNVRTLFLAEVRQLVLLYALLEPLFFAFVAPERKGSIFCVPLNHTSIPSLYKNAIQSMWTSWHKYTAFNILPLGNTSQVGIGTVEFRHLQGTDNYQTFKTWITSLKDLYTFIEKSSGFDIISLLLDGAPPHFLAREAIPLLAAKYSNSEIDIMLSDTLLDVKLSVGGIS